MRHAPCVGIDIYRPPVSLLAICVTFLSQIIYWHMSVYEANNDDTMKYMCHVKKS